MASSAIAATTLTDLKTRYQDGRVKIDYGVYSPTVDVSGNTVKASLGANFKVLGSGNRTISVHDLEDGQSVTVLVQGALNNVITINAYSDNGITPLSVKYGGGQDGTMVSEWTLFTILRIGGTSGAGSNFAIVGVMHGVGI